MAPTWFAATSDSDYMMRALMDGTVQNMSGGAIPKLTLKQAAGLLGSWVIESGRTIQKGGFRNFDVIEEGAKAGRGLSQYTGVRRTPYDIVAAEAIKRGENVNSAQWQLQYFVNEYLGKYDKYAGGNSLVGYRKDFDPKNLVARFGDTAEGWARQFTGSAAEGFGYFRPGEPHQDRRNAAAREVLQHYQSNPVAPNSQAPAAPTGGGLLEIFQNPILKKLGLKGGRQSFNIDKLESTLGEIAQDASAKDVGFGIFASQKGNRNQAKKSWANLSKREQRAYTKVGRRALASSPNAFAPAGTDYSQLKIKGNRYGKKAFDHSGRSGKYDYSSYSGSQDLNKTLSIMNSPAGKAAARGGDLYGQAAMNLNTQGINTIAWQL